MHGIDWPGMKEKYGKLLHDVSCRQDLSFLIGELIGELNTSHTYVSGGDISRKAGRFNVGMLGADYEVDKSAQRYRFKKIYRVADWSGNEIPPLARPGLQVSEGDYLLQVNGREVYSNKEVYAYFQNLAKKQVILLVNDKPALSGAREITVEPASGEYTFRNQDWLEHNRLLVDKLSKGEIGYIYLPDTFTGSAADFQNILCADPQKD
jgi:tricorn protease